MMGHRVELEKPTKRAHNCVNYLGGYERHAKEEESQRLDSER